MSEAYFRLSTPSLDDTPITESRSVVQQFNSRSGALEAQFHVELSKDNEAIILKAFDDQGRAVVTALSYETANSLQSALSDALDTLEGLPVPARY